MGIMALGCSKVNTHFPQAHEKWASAPSTVGIKRGSIPSPPPHNIPCPHLHHSANFHSSASHYPTASSHLNLSKGCGIRGSVEQVGLRRARLAGDGKLRLVREYLLDHRWIFNTGGVEQTWNLAGVEEWSESSKPSGAQAAHPDVTAIG